MPVNAAGSFNVGRDYSFVFTINGQTITIPNVLVLEVSRKIRAQMHEIIPLNNDGKPVFRTTYQGYEYDIHLARQNGQMDVLIDALAQNYYQGLVPPTVSLSETVRNPDQSVDQTMLLAGTIVPESLGAFKSGDPVNDITLKLYFAERNSVGGASTSAVNLGQASTYL